MITRGFLDALDGRGIGEPPNTKTSTTGSVNSINRAWDEALHPRAPGGQFMAYDEKTGKGTGYGKKSGDVRVRQLQTALNRLGLLDKNGNKLAVDGQLGPLTTSAVKKAQQRLGLKPDGKVTPELFRKIKAMKPGKQAPAVKGKLVDKVSGHKTPVRPRRPVKSKFGHKAVLDKNRFLDDLPGWEVRAGKAKNKGGNGGDGETLREYWTEDPEGLAKWASSPHPWTALHAHLIKYMKEPMASKVTSSYYYEVFGTSPSGKHDKNKKKRDGLCDWCESRVGPKGYIHGWIKVGGAPGLEIGSSANKLTMHLKPASLTKDMDTDHLKALDNEFKGRATAMGKHGKVSKAHKAVLDELKKREEQGSDKKRSDPYGGNESRRNQMEAQTGCQCGQGYNDEGGELRINWKAADHPRGPHGKFIEAGGGGKGSSGGGGGGGALDGLSDDEQEALGDRLTLIQDSAADPKESKLAASVENKMATGEPLTDEENDFVDEQLGILDEYNDVDDLMYGPDAGKPYDFEGVIAQVKAMEKADKEKADKGGKKDSLSDLDEDEKEALGDRIGLILDAGADPHESKIAASVENKMATGEPLTDEENDFVDEQLGILDEYSDVDDLMYGPDAGKPYDFEGVIAQVKAMEKADKDKADDAAFKANIKSAFDTDGRRDIDAAKNKATAEGNGPDAKKAKDVGGGVAINSKQKSSLIGLLSQKYYESTGESGQGFYPDNPEKAAKAAKAAKALGDNKLTSDDIAFIKSELGEIADGLDPAYPKSIWGGIVKKFGAGRSHRPLGEYRRARARSAMRGVPVIRSVAYAPSLEFLAHPDENLDAWECRASYRADIETNGPLMRLEFSKFNNWYPIESTFEGKFLERVAPGAFVKTINERASQVKVLFNHGKDAQVGEKILGPISILEERTDGTYAEVALLDTSYNRDIVPGLRAGVYGSSFMFHVMDDKWDNRPERSAHNPDGLPERTVTAVRLLEFGPVTWPANPQSSAGIRSGTDRYFSDLRSQDPRMYDSVAQKFHEFRTSNRLVPRTSRRGVDPSAVRQINWATEREAAANTSAPDQIHALGLTPDQRAAQLRGLQLLEL